ncbi:MAG: TonB-dependent receptor [Saprospiraceae bacterium]|nr:TonB-dependent receptor [Candidatus Opimibacter skivensis]
MKTILTSMLVMLLAYTGIGQDCTIRISGQVLDRATREPLEYTTVSIQETNQSVLADSAGAYVLEGLCSGDYHLRVFHLGCPPGEYFLSLRKDTMLTILLDHHGELLREVVVEGKPNSFQESQNQQTITSSMIRDQAGQSLADMTENIAGVRTIRNGSGITKPVIHGLYGNRVAIINNGLLQAGQQWGADHAPEIDPNSVTVITVVKGSDAIEYGSQALGGALLVEAGPIKRDPHLHGTFGYAYETNGRGHTLTGMANRSYKTIDWRLTGTWKKAGDHHTPDYFLTNTGASELNGSLQLVFRPTEKVQHQVYYSLFTSTLGIFAGSHISNLTDLEEAIGREEPFNINDYFSYDINPPKQEISHHLLKYSGKKFVDENIFLEWTYGLQADHRQEFDVRRGNRSDIPALDLQLWSNNFQLKYINDKSRVRYKAGVQATITDNSNDYDTGILPLIPDYLESVTGLYSLFQYPVGKLVLEAGARYDLQLLKAWPITLTLPREIVVMEHVFHDYAFSAGAVFKATNDDETRLQLVVARRSPESNELYSNGLHQGVAGIEEGNWLLQPEVSFKSIMTQALAFTDLLHVELSLYSHLVYDYIYLKPDDELRLTIRGAFPVYKYTQQDAWIRGADIVLISDFSHHLEWNAKFSWVRGTTLEDGKDLSLMPPAYVSSSLAWAFHDSPVWKGARIAVGAEYTTMQEHWDPESELLAPPSDYFLLGIRFNTGIKLGSRIFYAGIAIENLLNIRYRDYLNRLRYYADEQGINARFILRYEF